MNALTTYFESTGDNVAKLAERIGRAPSTITRPLRGERNCSMNVALAIEEGTGGVVKADAFMAICLDAKRSANEAKADPSDQTEASSADRPHTEGAHA